MESPDIASGLSELSVLAELEYRVPLDSLIEEGRENPELVINRLGRLIGVTLKEPFARPVVLSSPSEHTGSFRGWQLHPDLSALTGRVSATWQYEALDRLRRDPEIVSFLGGELPDVESLVQEAQYERGFFGFLAISIRKYVCRDPEVRAGIEEQFSKVRASGVDVRSLTPEVLVSSGGLTLGAYLVQAVPILGFMGAPVIAGLVLLLYLVGVDAFCSWSRDKYLETVRSEQ